MWVILVFLAMAAILYGLGLCIADGHTRAKDRKDWWPEGVHKKWRLK